jgi:hypothetical protein
MALRTTLLEGLVMMSGFQGRVVWQQAAFESASAAGLVTPTSSELEKDFEDSRQAIRDTLSSKNFLSVKKKETETSIMMMRPDPNGNCDPLTENELREIDEAVERDLDLNASLAMVLWEDIRVVSRKTKKFAEAVLDQNEEDLTISNPSTNPATNPLRSSASQSKDDKDAGEAATNVAAPKSKPGSKQKRVPSPAPSLADSTSARKGSIDSGMESVEGPQAWTSPPSHSPLDKRRENSLARAKQESVYTRTQTLIFATPGKQKLYEVPFSKVRTWDVRLTPS